MKYQILDKNGKLAQLKKRLRTVETTHYELTVYQSVLEQQAAGAKDLEQKRLSGELSSTAEQIRLAEIEILVLQSHLKDVL